MIDSKKAFTFGEGFFVKVFRLKTYLWVALSLDKRVLSLDKRALSLDKRALSLDKRALSLDKRNLTFDKKLKEDFA